ncbi:hypothetical protein OQA88_10876 [Cercophora sp. LCS_1]
MSAQTTGELVRRLELVQELEEYWHKNFEWLTQKHIDKYRGFNDLELSVLLEMDYAVLCFLMNDTLSAREAYLRNLNMVPTTIKMCKSFSHLATKKISQPDIDAYLSASRSDRFYKPDPVSESSEDEEAVPRRKTKFDVDGKARRNSFFADKRREIDSNRCVITGTRDPEVCHILPLAANSTETLSKWWGSCLIFLTSPKLVEPLPGQTGFELSNMLSLAPNLRDWWEKGYFGLKYLDAGNTSHGDDGDPDQIVTLRAQFHWMVWRKRDIGKKPDTPLGRTVEDIKAAFSELGSKTCCGDCGPSGAQPVFAISRPGTGFSVETGDIVEIRVPKQHMEKMALALKVQWALVKILAMAGGPEAVEDTPYHPEFLDENWEFPGVAASWRDLIEFGERINAAEAEEEQSRSQA